MGDFLTTALAVFFPMLFVAYAVLKAVDQNIRAAQQNAMLMRETLLNIQHACESAERRLSGIEAMIYNATKYRGTSLDQMQAMQENDI